MSGNKDTVSSSAPAAASVRVSTATYGRAIPRLYGKNRIQINTIWRNDFKSIEHKTTQDAGGKGGSGTTTNISYTYTVALAMAVCSGVTSAIDNVWVGKSKGSLSQFGFSFYTGNDTQTAFGFIQTNYPDEALSYRGTSYIASGLFDLGGDASIPQVTVEVTGPLSGVGAGSVTTGDANPASVIYDLLTAVDAVGIPSGKVGSITAMQNFCQASKILVSPAYIDQEPASDIIKRLLTIANTGVTYSDGILKFAPLADSTFTDNGATFTANTTAVYDLTDDDFLPASDDPIKCDRVSTADAKNKITVKFLNRDLDYADDIAESKDRASIEQSGERPEDPITFKEICDANVAHVVADHIKNRSVYIRNTYQFKLGWRFALLEPLDIVTITDSGLGLIKSPVRILEIEEDEDGGLSIKAEELPSLTLTGTRYPVPVSSGTGIDYNVAPGNANAPVIFEPPIALSGAPEAWIATSGGTEWGGCDVWISTDNATYARAGRITGNSRHGVLSALLASGAALDTVNTLAVDLGVSRSTLAPGTTQDATDLVTLCYVGGELLAYRDATLTGLNQYNLGYLVRGAYGTPIGSHASASKFIRLDGGVFKYSYSPDMIGRTIYVKLQSFNQFQGGIQDLDSITATSYVLAGAVVSNVSGLALEQPFTGTSVAIKWNRTPGALGYTVEVWSTVLERAVNVGDVTRFAYSWEDATADGGPFRDLTFKVTANSANGVSSSAATLVVNNPVPAALSGLSVTGGWESLFFKCTKPTDVDFSNILIYVSTTSGFTPNSTTLVYNGPANTVLIDRLNDGTLLEGGVDYYIRAAASDVFGASGLNMSSELTAQPLSASGAIGPGEVIESMIADLAITSTKLTALAVTAPKLAIKAVTPEKLDIDLGGGNLCINSSFEVDTNADGMADGWGVYNNGGDTTNFALVTGRRVGTLAQRIAWAAPNTATKGVWRSAPFLPSQTFVVSWYARATDTNIGTTMFVAFNINPVGYVDILNPPLTNQWQRYAVRLTWGASIDTNFFVSINGTGHYGWLEFDDFQLEQGDVLTGWAEPSADLNIRIDSLTSTVAGNTAAISSEAVTRASADTAIAATVTALTSTVSGNTAAISSEATTRASADSALAADITALTSTVAGNTAAISSEASTRASADTAIAATVTALTSTVSGNTAAISSEATTRASADSALAADITALTSTVAGNTAAISSEASTRASADTAIAATVTALTSTVSGNTAAISSEASTRASADSALSTSITTVDARLNTGGDIKTAVVSAQSTATTSLNSVNAKYTIAVSAGGFTAGVALSADSGGGESAMVLLADKFAFASPSAGIGSPYYYPFVMGMVDGVSQAGINGNLVVDGSIYARHISVTTLAAITADIGTITAGKVQNAAGTNYMNLNATGTQPFIKVGSKVELRADGTGYFSQGLLSKPIIVDSGDETGTWAGTTYTVAGEQFDVVDIDTGIEAFMPGLVGSGSEAGFFPFKIAAYRNMRFNYTDHIEYTPMIKNVNHMGVGTPHLFIRVKIFGPSAGATTIRWYVYQ